MGGCKSVRHRRGGRGWRPTGPRVDRLVGRPGFTGWSFVRRAGGLLDIAARTGAGINGAGGAQLLESGEVVRAALALPVGRDRAAEIRAFLPDQAEPVQIFDHRGGEVRLRPGLVKVLVAQHEHAAGRARALLRLPERPRMAEMQIPGGGRRQPPAIRRKWEHRLHRSTWIRPG